MISFEHHIINMRTSLLFISFLLFLFTAIAPILVPKNSYHGETPSSRPSLDDFLTIVPNNAAVPSSPSESVSSSSGSSYCSRSPPPEYMSENESMDQGMYGS